MDDSTGPATQVMDNALQSAYYLGAAEALKTAAPELSAGILKDAMHLHDAGETLSTYEAIRVITLAVERRLKVVSAVYEAEAARLKQAVQSATP